MKSREQIDTGSNANIQEIRVKHLERQEISHEEYHIQLNAESGRWKDELTARLDKITKVNGVA